MLANFGHQVGKFPICHSAWCPDCYREIPSESFLVYRAQDAEGNDMVAPGEDDDYRAARPDDHLVCSFDCDSCQKRLYSSQSPHDSDFFTMLMAGLRTRVGERRKPDAAISIALMVEIQRRLELDSQEALECDDRVAMRKVAEHAVYFRFCFCGALRGFEGTKVPINELRTQVALDEDSPGVATDSLGRFMPHVSIPLVGTFKARSVGVTELLVFVAAQTASGLRPGEWTKRLLDVLETMGVVNGWLFQTALGDQQRMSHFEERFYDLLILILSDQDTARLFADGIDILEDYHLARSFRRGATTRATNAGVKQDDIDWLCRWNTGGEETGGAPLRVLYSDRTQLLETYLRFSLAL
jgi:hypothetical protein